MKFKLSREFSLYLAFFFITLSWSNFFIIKGWGKLLEYIGLFFILYGIYIRKYNKSDLKRMGELLVVLFFFLIGLIVQELTLKNRLNAILSMFILASIAIIPCKYISKINVYIGIEKAIIFGIIISTTLSLVFDYSIFTMASEGIIFKFGFNGGLEHRNYFSYVMLLLYIIEYTLYRLSIHKKKYRLLIITMFILSTNSRSCFILLLLFIITVNLDKIRISNYKGTIIVCIFCFALVLIGIPAYYFLKNISETFFFRLNGLNNYLSIYGSNLKYILFGNLKIAHGVPMLSYDENIKSVIGWNGSTELVIFNVLLKNGLVGFIGYFIILKKYFKDSISLYNKDLKIITFAVIICFIVSAFVESYVANINHLFTIFIYLFLSNIKIVDLSIQKRGNKLV